MTTRQPLVVCLLLAVVLAVANGDTDAEYAAKFQQALKYALKQANMSSQDLTWNAKSVGSAFNCHIDRNYKPSARTVNELTPYDINVVGAIGDSVTAAFGANARNIIEDLIEYRGVSWSIGGDYNLTTVTTLPNIIKQYNPAVKGFSLGKGNQNSAGAHFNRAVSGAKAQNMYDQAEDLVEKIKADETVNFDDDWKLVTLWIGGNDLCQFCKNSDLTADNYVGNITRALDYLRENLPRTFVNVVQIINIEKLSEVNGFICGIVHWFTCSCKDDEKIEERSAEYQKKLEELIRDYKDKDDFAVVMQPFMEGIVIPRTGDGKVDMSFFAPDCFHFSGKGHAEGAIALWNNMIEPVGGKDRGWNFNDSTINCPDEPNMYFYTKANSPSFSAGSNPQQQQPQAAGSAAIIAGSVMGVMVVAGAAIALVIMALVVWRRQSSSAAENTPLLLDS